jgi:hypothetical protein
LNLKTWNLRLAEGLEERAERLREVETESQREQKESKIQGK